jgi:hypothetical protein
LWASRRLFQRLHCGLSSDRRRPLSETHNPTIQNLYIALSSRLTINDVLISLEWFGEAKDEGLLASHLRGLLLVDSPTGDV